VQIKIFTLLLFTLLLWFGAKAQVILTAETNSPPAGFAESIYISLGGGLLGPQGGTAMSWDLSSLPPGTLRVVGLRDETNNSVFPEAIYSSPGNIQFRVFETDVVVGGQVYLFHLDG
jgi:hypothetical protein